MVSESHIRGFCGKLLLSARVSAEFYGEIKESALESRHLGEVFNQIGSHKNTVNQIFTILSREIP
jgi:hypothetical protein